MMRLLSSASRGCGGIRVLVGELFLAGQDEAVFGGEELLAFTTQCVAFFGGVKNTLVLPMNRNLCRFSTCTPELPLPSFATVTGAGVSFWLRESNKKRPAER
jgi:hypothetical protein